MKNVWPLMHLDLRIISDTICTSWSLSLPVLYHCHHMQHNAINFDIILFSGRIVLTASASAYWYIMSNTPYMRCLAPGVTCKGCVRKPHRLIFGMQSLNWSAGPKNKTYLESRNVFSCINRWSDSK